MTPDDEILAQTQPAWLERAKQANPPNDLLTDPMRVNRELIPQVKEGVTVINSSPTRSDNNNNGVNGVVIIRAARFTGGSWEASTLRVAGELVT